MDEVETIVVSETIETAFGEMVLSSTEPDMVFTADAPVEVKERLIRWADGLLAKSGFGSAISSRPLDGGQVTRVEANGELVEVTFLVRNGRASLVAVLLGDAD